ncbi:signal transduction histidine kinase [Pseudoduganella lurida]|uniref:histidine kinase n=1 Tax=Pseudoduganella lurida TaxID=1036180 RepID=A0A562RD73_9BURK|nr:ATP-binding protein [Pseudoduganella lurida]TWI66356.1 signal transduction histidine kinase [Pseudoduganella lurida]
MTLALPRHDEAERLAVLDSYGILDTPTEKSFDDVVKLASQLLDAPIAAVNLIAEHRQWFKSEVGLGTREMPLDNSICKFALLEEHQLVVPDTREDERFSCNPLVAGEPGLRFYAGELLKTRDGVPLGTLCILSMEPRPHGLTEQQQFALSTLARQIMNQIELRKALNDQHALIVEQAAAQQALLLADQRKDEFLAMLAHELRNPLAPITSAAAILSTFDLDGARVRATSAIIARQAGHMTALIDDLLDVSRVTRGKVELELAELDVKDVIADAIEQVRPLIARHGHRLAVQLAPGHATVKGDRKRLVQVMTNLLSNAAKYTPDGGSIDIALETGAETLTIAIRDNGIGMSADLIANAFDLFSQGAQGLDRSQGGLGIGLALVKSLLQLHGGSVSASSAGRGTGTTFTVLLPTAGTMAAPRPPGLPERAAPTSSALRIGIVDDNEDAAITLALLLETFGHQVAIAHTPRVALETWPAFAPDVCLLDIGLPEMNGFDLARALRRDGVTHAVLIAVTGYAQEKDRQEALAAGFDELLAKPIDLEALNGTLQRVAINRKPPA